LVVGVLEKVSGWFATDDSAAESVEWGLVVPDYWVAAVLSDWEGKVAAARDLQIAWEIVAFADLEELAVVARVAYSVLAVGGIADLAVLAAAVVRVADYQVSEEY
jgi:hypothetical protein